MPGRPERYTAPGAIRSRQHLLAPKRGAACKSDIFEDILSDMQQQIVCLSFPTITCALMFSTPPPGIGTSTTSTSRPYQRSRCSIAKHLRLRNCTSTPRIPIACPWVTLTIQIRVRLRVLQFRRGPRTRHLSQHLQVSYIHRRPQCARHHQFLLQNDVISNSCCLPRLWHMHRMIDKPLSIMPTTSSLQ